MKRNNNNKNIKTTKHNAQMHLKIYIKNNISQLSFREGARGREEGGMALNAQEA
jgi:hypothetical protein